jgi:hypothetical protein
MIGNPDPTGLEIKLATSAAEIRLDAVPGRVFLFLTQEKNEKSKNSSHS